MSEQVDVVLVLAPPFIPDEPHLGTALLASFLKANDFSVAIHDMSIQMFHGASPEQRGLWDRSAAVALKWQQRETIDAFLEDHWDTLLDHLDQVMARGPKVVGFSCHMTNSVLSMELAKIIREKYGDKVTLVAGGPAFFVNEAANLPGGLELCMYGHPTHGKPELRLHMERWFANLDAIILDEGEAPLLELCKRVDDGDPLDGLFNSVRIKAPGQYAPLIRDTPIRDLSKIPFPTFEELDLSLYTSKQLPVLFNRGCIKKCTCCTERYRWGNFRARKAEDILAELKHHHDVLGVSQFNACDMLLNASIRELTHLCKLIIEEGMHIGWGGNVVVRKEMNLKLLKMMRQAGCAWLIFGIESGSPRIVELIGKKFTLEEGERNLANCRRAGIRTYINIIIGFPGETEEDFRHTMNYVRRNRDHIDWIILMAMFELFHHTEVVLKPEQYNLAPETVEGLVENFGVVDWSDNTGNTYEVRQYRFARMQLLLAELGLPDPTMQGDDLRRTQVKEELKAHKAVRNLLSCALAIDTDLDTPFVEVLEDLIADPEERIRAGACRMLGMMEDRRAMTVLMEALNDKSGWVKGEAAKALGRIADPAAIPFLGEVLLDGHYEKLPPPLQRNLARLRRIRKIQDVIFNHEKKLRGEDEGESEGE